VEGAQLAAMALDGESKIKNERFRNLILTTFSYELAEPLTSISKNASELVKPENVSDKSKREELAGKIGKEAADLNELITKLPSLINIERDS
jgi:K+-sensing histidine kinase KdpD